MKRELRMNRTPRIVVALLVALLALAFPTTQAFAGAGDPGSDPTASQYEDPGTNITDEGGSDDTEVNLVSTPSSNDDGGSSSGASLPFTGFDVGVLAIVALLLGATGLALRRLSAVK